MENQVLVLDKSYQPIDVLGWEAAISMWSTGKAEIVSEYDTEVHSAYLTMKLPAVIRLTTNVKRKVKAVKFSRVNVYMRDEYKCCYCGEKCDTNELTYDHVIPRSQGGQTNWTNIVSCCYDCNSWKGGRTPEQAKMRLLKKPVQPRALPNAMFVFRGRKTPEQWRDFMYWDASLDSD